MITISNIRGYMNSSCPLCYKVLEEKEHNVFVCKNPHCIVNKTLLDKYYWDNNGVFTEITEDGKKQAQLIPYKYSKNTLKLLKGISLFKSISSIPSKQLKLDAERPVTFYFKLWKIFFRYQNFKCADEYGIVQTSYKTIDLYFGRKAIFEKLQNTMNNLSQLKALARLLENSFTSLEEKSNISQTILEAIKDEELWSSKIFKRFYKRYVDLATSLFKPKEPLKFTLHNVVE